MKILNCIFAKTENLTRNYTGTSKDVSITKIYLKNRLPALIQSLSVVSPSYPSAQLTVTIKTSIKPTSLKLTSSDCGFPIGL